MLAQPSPFDSLRRGARATAPAMLLLALVLATMVLATSAARAKGLRLIRDAEIEDLLNDYARPIFRVAGLGSQRIRVRIVRHPSFNAFVLDGRNVFINTGTLMKSETPGQVIGVIAHETGHIAGGHLAARRREIKRRVKQDLLMKVLGIGAMVVGSVAGGDARSIGSGIGRGVLYGSSSVTRRAILLYTRHQESQADQAGIAFLNATHQSGRGMLETFEYFASQELFSSRYKDPYVLSHPMPQQRIAQLREIVRSSSYFNAKDSPKLQLRHDLMRAKLTGFLNQGNRRAVFNRYPSSDTTLPARYARAIAVYYADGIDAALPKIDGLISTRPRYPYFHELKGQLLLWSGRSKAAVAPLRKALTLSRGSNLIRLILAQALLGTQNRRYTKEAIGLLEKVVDKHRSGEVSNSTAYRYLARAYARGGRKPKADLAIAHAYFFEGKLADAKAFAKRAQTQFPRGSAQWIQAFDIISFKPRKH